MLKKLTIKATEDTPELIFDKDNSIFLISGRSLPEDAQKFYKEALEWMSKYIKSPNKETTIVLFLEYFNSSSARLIVKILIELETLSQKDNSVKIIWKYAENDDVMKERGEEIKNVVNIPIVFQAI